MLPLIKNSDFSFVILGCDQILMTQKNYFTIRILSSATMNQLREYVNPRQDNCSATHFHTQQQISTMMLNPSCPQKLYITVIHASITYIISLLIQKTFSKQKPNK